MIPIYIYMNKFSGKLFIASNSNKPIPLNKYTIYKYRVYHKIDFKITSPIFQIIGIIFLNTHKFDIVNNSDYTSNYNLDIESIFDNKLNDTLLVKSDTYEGIKLIDLYMYGIQKSYKYKLHFIKSMYKKNVLFPTIKQDTFNNIYKILYEGFIKSYGTSQ